MASNLQSGLVGDIKEPVGRGRSLKQETDLYYLGEGTLEVLTLKNIESPPLLPLFPGVE